MQAIIRNGTTNEYEVTVNGKPVKPEPTSSQNAKNQSFAEVLERIRMEDDALNGQRSLLTLVES